MIRLLITHTLLLLVIGALAGIFGAILGIGGGIILTPVLTIILGLPIKYAIGASIIAVIATSSGSTIAYLKDDMLNLRVAMFLEIATTIGAIVGALLTGVAPKNIIYVLFGCLLLFAMVNMGRKLWSKKQHNQEIVADKIAQKMRLNGHYYDKASQQEYQYQVKNVPGGFIMMLGAGLASGLLGIGAGAFKVIAMDNIMHMPLKPSSATSNLMMGVTAAASAMIYFLNGDIRPDIAAPIAIGILCGAFFGTRIMQHLNPRMIRIIFIPILAYMGLQMVLKGFGVNF